MSTGIGVRANIHLGGADRVLHYSFRLSLVVDKLPELGGAAAPPAPPSRTPMSVHEAEL